MKELPSDGQEIVQRQQQGNPQIHYDGFLSWIQRGVQGMGPVRGIFD
jgi:hypothetical protein